MAPRRGVLGAGTVACPFMGPFGFYFRLGLPRRAEYRRRLEEYKAELEQELKEVEQELEELRKEERQG